jgi:hypothetical protein
MKRAILSLAVLSLLLGTLLGSVGGRAATAIQTHYALIALDNPTSTPVTYSYWWGHVDWAGGGGDVAGTATIPPRSTLYHHWPYEAGSESDVAPLHVGFVSFVRGRTVPHTIFREYALTPGFGPAAEVRFARRYHFGWRPDRYLDLFDSSR